MLESISRITVRYQETDRMGIAYHSNYLIWCEIGRTEFFKKICVSYPDLEKKGYYLVVTEAQLSYKSPVTYEDEVEVITTLEKYENCSMSFTYTLTSNDRIIAQAKTHHAFVDLKGKVIKIPSIINNVLSDEISSTNI